jgi:hypothetical protein
MMCCTPARGLDCDPGVSPCCFAAFPGWCILDSAVIYKSWSGRPDLNRRPSAPKADALPSCATPRAM